MNSYERYLEDMLKVKEKEIDLYKHFIEKQLGCTIREEVMSNMKIDKTGAKEGRYKIITIPQSQYAIQID